MNNSIGALAEIIELEKKEVGFVYIPQHYHPVLSLFDEWINKVNPEEFLKILNEQAIRVTDHKIVGFNYDNFLKAFENKIHIHFAVKANPDPEILKILKEKKSGFECATYEEVEILAKAGLSEDCIKEKVTIGQTQMKRDGIRKSLEAGVRTFATDNKNQLKYITEEAGKLCISTNEINIHLRIYNSKGDKSGEGYSQSFNERYGMAKKEAINIAKYAKKQGLNVNGCVFHPGSGSFDKKLWDYGIKLSAKITKKLNSDGFNLNILNLSGGFDPSIPIEEYSKHINKMAKKYYKKEGLEIPYIHAEPGRSLTANSEVIIGGVASVIKKKGKDTKIATLTTGVSENGTLTDLGLTFEYYKLVDEKFKKLDVGSSGANLHGPACANFDVMARGTKIPEKLDENCFVVIKGAGAYSKTMEMSEWCAIRRPLEVTWEVFKQGLTNKETLNAALKINQARVYLKGAISKGLGFVDMQSIINAYEAVKYNEGLATQIVCKIQGAIQELELGASNEK